MGMCTCGEAMAGAVGKVDREEGVWVWAWAWAGVVREGEGTDNDWDRCLSTGLFARRAREVSSKDISFSSLTPEKIGFFGKLDNDDEFSG